MAEEEKTTNIPDEADTPDEAVTPDADDTQDEAQDTEASESKDTAASAPAPVRKKDRSKVNLEPKPGEQKKKKKKEPGKIRRWFKDFFSELKKVTWPSFSKVLRQTGTVLLVTVIFLLFLIAFDSLFSTLYKILIGQISVTGTIEAASTLMLGGGGLL